MDNGSGQRRKIADEPMQCGGQVKTNRQDTSAETQSRNFARSRMIFAAHLGRVVAAALALSMLACHKEAPQADPQAVAGEAQRTLAPAVQSAVEHSASSEPMADSGHVGSPAMPAAKSGTRTQADGDDDDLAAEDEDERDYWKGVQFDATNFSEVLDYIHVHYIDANPDTHRAWVEAANFALLSLEPGEELLPESFYKVRTGKPEEEGRLDGKTQPFQCRNAPLPGVVLHVLPTDEYLKAKRPVRKKGRLSDEEVLALREKIKIRSQLYHDSWLSVPFGRPQFDCVMAYVGERIKQIRFAAAQNSAGAAAKSARSTADREPAPGLPGQAPRAEQGREVAIAEAKPATPPAKDAAPAKDPGAAKQEKSKDDAKEERPKPLPDLNRAWESAAQGYLYALDPHSSIIPRKAWDESTDKTEDNSFEGIGAVLTQRDDQTVVENPMEGRPAWRAGIRAGDIIHKVDGEDIGGLALNKVVKKIRGPRATKVVLTVSRETDPEPKDITITRENIEIKNVDGKLLPDYPGVAHVKMTGFIPTSTRALRGMIDKLATQAPDGKLTGLVLDLRNNSGGLLTKAIEIADAFLTSGRIVSVKSRKKPEEIHEASLSSSDYEFPVVVLVSDGSASASEIVASALQDNGRGLVVGSRTFGKASVQTLFEPALHYDYYIKLTVARYYAPSGYTIQVVGVQPDVEVAPTVDGKMPVGFREENLNNHLVPIQGRVESPWSARMPELKACVASSGQADKIAKREPKPQIHPDYQLLRAADYLRCLVGKPTAK